MNRTAHPQHQVGRLLAALGLLVASPIAGAAQQGGAKPLYERLGGVYAIATVVDDFIERLLVNAVLNANPRINQARASVPKAGLKYRVTELVCQATGGPCRYTGRPMPEAHRHLAITEREWQAMRTDFQKTLEQFKVPEAEQRELFAIVESVKPQIVGGGASSR